MGTNSGHLKRNAWPANQSNNSKLKIMKNAIIYDPGDPSDDESSPLPQWPPIPIDDQPEIYAASR